MLDGLVCVRVDGFQCQALYLCVQFIDTLTRIEHLPRVSFELVEDVAHFLLKFFFLVPLCSKVAYSLLICNLETMLREGYQDDVPRFLDSSMSRSMKMTRSGAGSPSSGFLHHCKDRPLAALNATPEYAYLSITIVLPAFK